MLHLPPPAGPTLPTFALNDATLEYELSGDSGPLVVQLHGLTSSRERDVQLGLDLPRALRNHRVLRYDARGHGGSTGSLDPASYSWPRLADDLLALLDHVAPGEQVHGVGPSMGSATLLHAALRDPARFASLTLVAPPTAWASRVPQRSTYLRNAGLVEQQGISAFLELGLTTPIVPAMADAPSTAPAVPERLLPSLMRGAAASDLPPLSELATISSPTLILAWSDDPTHPVSTAATLAVTLPDSRFVIAETPYGVMAWPGLFADHVTGHVPKGLERATAQQPAQPTSRNVATVERYLDGFHKTDHAQILSCLTDDITWTVFGAFQLTGKEAYDAAIESPDFSGHPQLDVVRLVEQDDTVMAELTGLVHRADGTPQRLSMAEVFVLRDGLICERRAWVVPLQVDDHK